jgi:SNF2 family DNA or RNA helicase
MGLGKTIQSISLMLINPRPPKTSVVYDDKKALSNRVDKGTLVVGPLALIKQWEAEIKNRVDDSHKMKVCVHHGPQRTKRFEDLRKYDVVITTYQILVSEHSSSSEREDGPQFGCFGIHWYRVILDEAHTIKNRNAKATKACYALRAEYRWCLTGTPMQNNLDELQSLIKFLRIKPYNDLKTWKSQITEPMRAGRGNIAMKRLNFYLKAFMKRRTKDVLKQEGALNPGGKPTKDGALSNGLKITERKVEAVSAEFTPEERSFYSRLEQRTDRNIDAMMSGAKMNYASALVMLLRLRQACNHPQLVGGSIAQDRDALTTGQAQATQNPRKAKVPDREIDDMADLLGGLSVQTKQCDMCQTELTEEEAKSGALRCAECNEDLAAQKKMKHSSSNRKKHRSKTENKPVMPPPRIPKNRKVVLDDSDEEDDGEWLVSEGKRNGRSLGKVGGSDDENAEGGGESIGSSDSDTGDESSLRTLGSHQRQVISLDSTDEESHNDANSSQHSNSESEDESISTSSPKRPSPTTSAKISHLLRLLHAESASHKFIVFSQFTSMLDLIEPFLARDSLRFTRYDGSMRNDHREASLERLRNDPKIRILLCSLKCGSLGLNLTAASRVVILEPFWNPFVEEQAIDRVHRLNQTRNVVVYKFTVADTVEARILELQEKKRALAEAAIEGKQAAGKLSMKDILKLFRRDAEHEHPVEVRGKDRGLMDADSMRMMAAGAEQLAAFRSTKGGKRVVSAARPQASKDDEIYGRRW